MKLTQLVSDRPPYYTAFLLVGLVGGLLYWQRAAKRDGRLMGIYLGAVMGMFLGAKAVYLAAQGWSDWPLPDRWVRLAVGRSVLGALLGGYIGVEWAKRASKYPFATGDRFALMVPVSLVLGRVGCLLNGCCLGVVCDSSHWWTLSDFAGRPRWPAPLVELLFNLVAIGAFWLLRRTHRLAGQHFHLYLIAYGFFRMAHEPLRDTPKTSGGWSGYQVAAGVLVLFGAFRFWQRQHQPPPQPSSRRA